MPTSKPTNIDAQRILAIMDELKEKLTHLSVVTPQVLEGLQSEEGQITCELLGADLVKQFTEQIRLEELYVVASAASDGNFGHAEDTEDVREDVKSLQKNTLELCRRMRGVANIVQELRNFQENRPGAVIQFLKTLADMQELTLKRLTTTVEEERSRSELLEHYKNREQEASKRRTQLEKDLNHIRRECERAQSQRTEILTKLKADLLDVKDSKLERMTQLRNRYEDRMKKTQEEHLNKTEGYLKQITKVKEENAKLKTQSNDSESQQKKGVRRFEIDVEGIIRQYDRDVKETAYHMKEYEDGFKKEQKHLSDLREHFSKVDSEKDCIANEENIAEARKQKMERERQLRNESAAMVQAFFRGIIQREQYQTDKKKRKKGGKGGKKKGK